MRIGTVQIGPTLCRKRVDKDENSTDYAPYCCMARSNEAKEEEHITGLLCLILIIIIHDDSNPRLNPKVEPTTFPGAFEAKRTESKQSQHSDMLDQGDGDCKSCMRCFVESGKSQNVTAKRGNVSCVSSSMTLFVRTAPAMKVES